MHLHWYACPKYQGWKISHRVSIQGVRIPAGTIKMKAGKGRVQMRSLNNLGICQGRRGEYAHQRSLGLFFLPKATNCTFNAKNDIHVSQNEADRI